MIDHPRLNATHDYTTLVTWHDGSLHFLEPLPEGSDGYVLLTLYFGTYIFIALLGLALALIWQRRGSVRIARKQIFDCVVMATVGGAFGARIGEVLFYHPQFFFEEPRRIIEHTSGYSVHGAIGGAMLALTLWSRWVKKPVLHILDQAPILLALGTFVGRLTNFYLGELHGRPASPDLPWAMRFAVDNLPRHPVMLYQALSEGLLLLIVLCVIRSKAKNVGTLAASGMIGYGVSRTLLEFFREPDAGIAYPFLGLTVGQLLSIALAIAGAIMLWYAKKNPRAIDSIAITPVAIEQRSS